MNSFSLQPPPDASTWEIICCQFYPWLPEPDWAREQRAQWPMSGGQLALDAQQREPGD